jgi:chromate transporter
MNPSARNGHIPLFQLFAAFFRIGLTAFGGPAMIPHIRRLVINAKGWITESDFKTGLAVCQAIPGATVAQLAAYVGLRLRGLGGALTAFAAFMLPASLLITALSALYFRYQNLPRLLLAFDGLKILVVAIVLSASLDFIAKYTRQRLDKFLALGAALAFVAKIHPVPILLCVVAAGMVVLPAPAVMPLRPMRGGGFRTPVLFLGGLVAGYALLWMTRPDLFHLARLMMGIDLVAFGGGFAALPIMLHEVVTRMGWMTQAMFMDGIALGQVTPGPIVLTSAFVGYAQAGLAGAVAAALGIFTPSLLILIWVVPVCDRLLSSRLFQKALRASLASLGGLMTAVAVGLGASLDWTWPGALLGLAAFAALQRKIDVLWVVLAGTAAWLLFTAF